MVFHRSSLEDNFNGMILFSQAVCLRKIYFLDIKKHLGKMRKIAKYEHSDNIPQFSSSQTFEL